MNDPNYKYSFQKHNTEEHETNTQHDGLLFFNYQEFLINNYKPLYSSNIEKKPLLINHFPNVYVHQGSAKFKQTRIIRVPRVYDKVKHSDLIPQFSEFIPGHEPAALNDGTDSFDPKGSFDGNVFGYTSQTALVPDLLSQEDFVKIVREVNSFLFVASDPHNIHNLIENILNLFTANLFSMIVNKYIFEGYRRRMLRELEEYIDKVNEGFKRAQKDLRVISPKRSGFLSVSIF
ncbi:uncharacterized protein PRCAT00006042001 [Priceomyces carsonii]|uniref:uncharacterized protein n=1 Tax=Priceomyces carsonii TaxID=28549 RepID=UPI002ED78EDD|nr:unnamed protein product [Priceomyces carsonii]